MEKECNDCKFFECGEEEYPCNQCCKTALPGTKLYENRPFLWMDKEINGNDPVNRPAHYTDGQIEVIDFIEDKGLGFCLGNAVKYITRAGKKDPDQKATDIRKAIWYLNRYLKEIGYGE